MNNPTNTTPVIDLDKLRTEFEAAMGKLDLPRDAFDKWPDGRYLQEPIESYWSGFQLARQQTPVTGKVTQHVKTYSERETEWKADNAVGVVPTQRMLREEVAELRAALATHQATLAAPAEHVTVIANLASVVRAQNGNRHADINELLARAEKCLATLAAPAEQAIYDVLYEMRLAPRHQLEDAAKRIAAMFASSPKPATLTWTQADNLRRTLNNIKAATRLADVRSLANLGLGFLDATPPKPAASQQAVVNSEQQEKVAPPPRGTGNQHHIGTDDLSSEIMNLTTKRTMSHFATGYEMDAYKEGYLEARIEAAELATEFARLCRAQRTNNDNSNHAATTAAADKGN